VTSCLAQRESARRESQTDPDHHKGFREDHLHHWRNLRPLSLCRNGVRLYSFHAPTSRVNICYHCVAEVAMPEYVIERDIPGAGNLSDAELQEIARKSVGVLKDMGPKIEWLHSYVTGDKVYCVYLAPDEETIREHGRRGGFPVSRVAAVRRMIDPGTAG
jgi:hypothetical protein